MTRNMTGGMKAAGSALLAVLPYLFIAAGLIYGTSYWKTDLPVSAALVGGGILIAPGWLVKRAFMVRPRLPRTGLEIPLLVFAAVIALSVAVSPSPRLGLERMAWLLSGAALFYILLDVLEKPAQRAALRMAIIAATAPALMTALLDTYARYLEWWGMAGTNSVMPPFPPRFLSILGHSNFFMALMNLVAPVALVLFLRAKSRAARVFSALWLVMYVIALPFSSSRGGWLGAAAWAGVLVLHALIEESRWKKLLQVVKRRVMVALPAGLAVLVMGGLAALRFYQFFAGANPTHGSVGGLNRESIWSTVLQVWQGSPWLGAGPGRLALEMMAVSRSFPARWTSIHAQSTPLQVLGESGILGLAAFTVLVVAALALFARAYFKTEPGERVWVAASLGAVAASLLHGLFDDFTFFPALLGGIAAHAALILAANGELVRFRRLPAAVLAVPVLFAAVSAAFSLWAYSPYYYAASQADSFTWAGSAQDASESARRDAEMPLYHSGAGLAYALAASDSGDSQQLNMAVYEFEQSLRQMPNNSVHWANLAVLRWHSGQPELALETIEKAMLLCPQEPGFWINAGWFYEQLGQTEDALQRYGSALELNPKLATHPFWSGSPLREQAKSALLPAADVGNPRWQAAREKIQAGDLASGRLELAEASWYGEPQAALLTTSIALAEKSGDSAEAMERMEALADVLDKGYRGADYNGGSYYLYSRLAYPAALVPGYIRLTEDVGQFDALRRLVDLQIADGECEDAAFTWQVLQRELRAGEITGQPYPPMPACQPSALAEGAP